MYQCHHISRVLLRIECTIFYEVVLLRGTKAVAVLCDIAIRSQVLYNPNKVVSN